MKRVLIIGIMLMLVFPGFVFSQQVGVKTNTVYLATTTPNLSIEWAPSYRISLDIQGSYNGWVFGHKDSNKKIKHWLIMPEMRFWIYEAFDGHFLGVHPFYGEYNMANMDLPLGIFNGLKENRYEGYGTGVGLSYGYQWYLGHHWNLEMEFGFGYAYLNYDMYHHKKCSLKQGHFHKHYFGPTKLGVSVVYLFKSKKR
ncbi:MAG: DUF3575 domain-containing protein [Odoribacter sp.]|nr:DUF3575 domain-containing protein [Odoribacter sp.]